MDDVAVELALAACLEHADLARRAGRAERTRREIDIGAGVAALQPQFAGLGAVPEMLGLRCRFRSRARWLGHVDEFLPAAGRSRLAGSDLDATLDCPPSTVQRSCRMPRIPARAQWIRPESLYRHDPPRYCRSERRKSGGFHVENNGCGAGGRFDAGRAGDGGGRAGGNQDRHALCVIRDVSRRFRCRFSAR